VLKQEGVLIFPVVKTETIYQHIAMLLHLISSDIPRNGKVDMEKENDEFSLILE